MTALVRKICADFTSKPNDDFVGVGTCEGQATILAVHGDAVRGQLVKEDFSAAATLVTRAGSRFIVEPRDDGKKLHALLVTPGAELFGFPPEIRPGDSTFRHRDWEASVGCLLKDEDHPNRLFFLTAEHVLWDGTSETVFTADGKTDLQIGERRVSSSVLTEPQPPLGDWGLVELTDATGLPEPRCRPASKFRSAGSQLETLQGQIVEQCGAKSGPSIGQVCAADWCALVEYRPKKGKHKIVRFENHIVVRSLDGKQNFATKGDSGAIVYLHPESTGGELEAVGILIATTADDQFALVLPLHTVLTKLPKPFSGLILA